MGHDGTAVLAIDKFNEDRKDIWDKTELLC